MSSLTQEYPGVKSQSESNLKLESARSSEANRMGEKKEMFSGLRNVVRIERCSWMNEMDYHMRHHWEEKVMAIRTHFERMTI